VPGGIPYQPFPEILLGPITLRTFGLCVALGIVLGGWVFVRRNRRLGIPAEKSERVVIALVVAGLVGARLLWVLTSLDQIDSPVDVIAVWNGGLQFSGGFIAAILLAPFLTRGMTGTERWHLLDSAAIGLAIGLAVGRVGCYAVGEHLGGPTSFPLGIHYRGGQTVEGPLQIGQTYWSTPVLEIIYLVVILAVMLWIERRGTAGAGALAGLFCTLYAVCRFLSDFLREYDRTVLGLTGAQYMVLAMFVLGVWFLWTARGRETPGDYRQRLPAEAVAEDGPDGPLSAEAASGTTSGTTSQQESDRELAAEGPGELARDDPGPGDEVPRAARSSPGGGDRAEP
jgi:phosphatidylglycerol:prolipoprotein diacylglycerol transferase